MNFKCILWILLLFINHVVGEFLQMSISSINMSRVIRSISGITITACHMECGKEPACHDIAITERTPDNQLPTCYLLKEDNEHYDEGAIVMTTMQAIGYGVRVHGGWSDWRNFTNCTKPCGSGTLKQRRDCDSPKPAFGGDNCKGIEERTVKCNTFGCPVVNVALGKKTTQSSTYENGREPSKAVDGDTDFKTFIHTKLEPNPWWEVDLGEVKLIKEIRLYAYVDNIYYNLGLLAESRTKKEESWTKCNNFGRVKNRITKYNVMYNVQCHDQVTNARFVRIRSTKKCYLNFNEVEIFGY